MNQSTSTSSQSPVAPPNSLNVNKLGFYLDGWADIVEGMGSKAGEVRQNVLKSLQDRNMPEITLGNKNGYVSLVSNEKRDYVVAETNPGARTVINISQHGKDLYASWRTWLEPKVNWGLLKWFGLGAAVLGLFTGGIQQGGGFFGPSQTSFSLTGWIFSTIGFALLAAFGLAIAGRIFKGGFLAYFFIEPNVFDAEDITAMSLSVHKSIIRSLDISGIDISKLRIKEKFTGGRRGEDL